MFTYACNDKSTTDGAGDGASDSTETSAPAQSGTTTATPAVPDAIHPAQPIETSPPTSSTKTMTEEFMALVNDHRTDLGLKPLIHDEVLGDIAREHSEDMANRSVAFGHTGFSQRCTDARAVMGGGNWCGENVAMGQKTVQAAFNSWMNSSGHRANIEKSRATHTGFGYKQTSTGTYYWTQIFLEVN